MFVRVGRTNVIELILDVLESDWFWACVNLAAACLCYEAWWHGGPSPLLLLTLVCGISGAILAYEFWSGLE